MKVEMFTFLISAAVCLGGALGVVLLRNAVHNALSLIATLFGIAVLFMSLGAYFLAAVQVIVYAGAIVVLFLFVIMLLGVDKVEKLESDPVLGQRPGAVLTGLAILGLSVTALLSIGAASTGAASSAAAVDPSSADINSLARVLFTDHVFAFEVTSVLLTIAVIGAVVMARRSASPIDAGEFPEGTVMQAVRAQREARAAEEAERRESAQREAAELAEQQGEGESVDGENAGNVDDSVAVADGSGSQVGEVGD